MKQPVNLLMLSHKQGFRDHKAGYALPGQERMVCLRLAQACTQLSYKLPHIQEGHDKRTEADSQGSSQLLGLSAAGVPSIRWTCVKKYFQIRNQSWLTYWTWLFCMARSGCASLKCSVVSTGAPCFSNLSGKKNCTGNMSECIGLGIMRFLKHKDGGPGSKHQEKLSPSCPEAIGGGSTVCLSLESNSRDHSVVTGPAPLGRTCDLMLISSIFSQLKVRCMYLPLSHF